MPQIICAGPSPAFRRFSSCYFSSPIYARSPLRPPQRPPPLQKQAGAQFERAEQQRAALNIKPRAKRTLADYRQVVTSYRRVYLITPRAAEVPDALLAISSFTPKWANVSAAAYYQSAVDAYRFLLHEYPTSRHGPDAMLLAPSSSAISSAIIPAQHRPIRIF